MALNEHLLTLAREGASIPTQTAALLKVLGGAGISSAALLVVEDFLSPGVMLFARKGGASRVGGAGSVEFPVGVSWPVDQLGNFLPFMYEIDFGAIRHADRVPLAPTAGRLLLFLLDAMPDQSEAALAFGVWAGPDATARVSTEGRGYPDQYERSTRLDALVMPILSDTWQLSERLEAAGEEWYELKAQIRLLLPYNGLNCHQLMGPGIPRGQAELDEYLREWFRLASPSTVAQYEPQLRDGHGWTHLLTPNSDDDAGIFWGDWPTFLVMIPTEDLRQRNFERIVLLPT